MKYVIFTANGGLMLPVIMPDPVVHSMIEIVMRNDEGEVIEQAKPDSAGFFGLIGGTVVLSDDSSESLKLGPKPERDTRVIQQVIDGIDSTSSYIDWDEALSDTDS